MTPEQTTQERRPGLLTQQAALGTLDVENRTATVVFSSGALVRHYVQDRGQWRHMPTRVVIEESAVDMEFLRQGGPVLDSHFSYHTSGVIGSVEDAWIENGECRARIRFADTEDVSTIWQKISQGHLRNISAGFEVLEQELRTEQGPDGTDMEVMMFTRWKPMELSVVPIPADEGSRIQSRGEIIPPKQTPIADTHGDGAPRSEARQATQVVFSTTRQAAAAADHQRSSDMADDTNTAVTQTATPAAPPPVDQTEILRQERARVAAIEETGAALNLDAATIRQARESGTSADDFRAQAIRQFAQAGQEQTRGVVTATAHVTADATDRFRQGAALGLMARAGLGGERNEFTGLTLSELARQSLDLRGERPPVGRREMVGAAFVQSAGAHSTSDFANVLANVMGKAALMGWEEAEETYQLWTRAGTATDFKPTKRVGLGLIDALPERLEGADYAYGTVGDRGETITLASYGKVLKITREAIINDDLSLFSSLPRAGGRASRRTIGNLCYAALTSNPTMSDGTALFHSTHNNLAGSGAAPSVATLAAARAAMRKQKESAEGSALNIRPAYFIVPAALETTAQQLMTSIVDPTAQKGHANNPVAGMAEVVADARLDDDSATSWYLTANPNMHDTVEVVYLDGVQEPFIEERTAWSNDGVELKIRIDAGVAPLDYRTFYKNPGA